MKIHVEPDYITTVAAVRHVTKLDDVSQTVLTTS